MVETKYVNASFGLLLFLFFGFGFLGTCSPFPEKTNNSNIKNTAADCILPKASHERKIQLERGIRGKVNFLGEPENVRSLTLAMSAYNIPALSLAVIHHGQIEWADLYQNENFPDQKKLNCTSIFQAASLSKPVTFLAAVRMQAAGEIDLDENIQNYLKDFLLPQGKHTAENPVTFRNIFSHTSGITPGGYQGYARDMPLPSDLDILRGSPGVNSPAIEVVAPPNETLAYSGGAYTLAELALQDIFKDEFSNIMKNWILEPAGMNHSAFTQPLPASKADQAAIGHTASGDALDGGWRNHPEQAAAGLWSNAMDMARFLIEIHKAYRGKSSIFSPSDIEAMISQERDGQMYGFLLNRAGDGVSITHYGGNAGYRTGMTIDLASGNGLAYLINSDNGGSLGNELLLSASKVYDWRFFQQIDVQRKQVALKVLRGLTGEYKWNGQVDLSIALDENKNQLSLYFPNGDEYKLVAIVGDDLAFIHPATGVRVVFLMKDDFRSFTLYGQTAVRR